MALLTITRRLPMAESHRVQMDDVTMSFVVHALTHRLSNGGFWLALGGVPHYTYEWIDPAGYDIDIEIGDHSPEMDEEADPPNIAKMLHRGGVLWGFDQPTS